MPKFEKGYAVSMRSQFLFLLSRAFKQQWRCTSHNYTTILICGTNALLSGWPFVGFTPETDSDVLALISITFFSVSISCTAFSQQCLPYYLDERIVFYREQASRMYHPWPWGLACLLSELPYVIFYAFFYGSIFYVSV